jgi:hypothetical protein
MGSNVSRGVARATKTEAEAERLDRRRDRFRLLDQARRILPGEAVARCHLYAADSGDGQKVAYVDFRVGTHGTASIGNIVTCGSVWHCPVCAAKIAARRREEINTVLTGHYAAGGEVFMGTFTVPHHAFSKCRELRVAISDAFRWLQGSAEWKRAKESIGFVGSIRALEVTNGAAGWHPHLHVLFLTKDAGELEIARFRKLLFDRWSRALVKFGLGKPSPAAFDFEKARNGGEAGTYLVKGGVEYEMTSGHTKLARGQNRSPWRILMDSRATGSDADFDLFRDYALAFKGAKQLTWSKGLKDLYGVNEVEDDAVAAEEEKGASTVLRVDMPGYEQIHRKRLLTAVMDACERYRGYELITVVAGMGIDVDSLAPGDWKPPPFEVVKL